MKYYFVLCDCCVPSENILSLLARNDNNKLITLTLTHIQTITFADTWPL